MARADTVPEEQKKALGQRLKLWRQFRGLSQEELARAVGMTQAAISFTERGKGYPTDEAILRIADALKIRPQLLEDRRFTDIPGLHYGSIPWRLAMGDWRSYTIDEIAEELDSTRHTIEDNLSRLRSAGCCVLYTRLEARTGKRLDPPKDRHKPRERVNHNHCKGCKYGLTTARTVAPTGCLYYPYTGRHRPNPIDGHCPAKDTSRKRRNIYKGVE